ncbi:PRY1 [[Candida] subhashii]|uniref:PRY1 n=1 Tax=[Candida] subhashii TaxID=561895 RepID=A0A8J5QHJ9_9ASCO|nr:PRY1 [[Candida] subhashii]KAG7662169.1 PRY1 [[Candida] subhashii]
MKFAHSLASFAAIIATAKAVTLTIEVTLPTQTTWVVVTRTVSSYFIQTTALTSPPATLVEAAILYVPPASIEEAPSPSSLVQVPSPSSSTSAADSTFSSSVSLSEATSTTSSSSSSVSSTVSSISLAIVDGSQSSMIVDEAPAIPVVIDVDPEVTDPNPQQELPQPVPDADDDSEAADPNSQEEFPEPGSDTNDETPDPVTNTDEEEPAGSVDDTIPTEDIDWSYRMVEAHNFYRAQHGVGNLIWSNELQQFSKEYARTYDCSGVLVHSDSPYGENLAAGYLDVNGVDAWYLEEIELYDFTDPGWSDRVGHLTQLLWKDTTKVGCYRKPCDGFAYTQYTICEYWIQGNIVTTADLRGVENFRVQVPPLLQEPYLPRPGSTVEPWYNRNDS